MMITVPWGQRLGGAESTMWRFLRYVDRTRLEPVVVFFEAGPFEREVASLGIPTIVLGGVRLRNFRAGLAAVRCLARELRREQPDLLLNWSAKVHIYGAIAALFAGMPGRVIWWQHSVPDGHWLDRLATLLPARAIGCSSQASSMAQQRLWPRRDTFIVYPGIESAAPRSPERAAALRRDLGIAPEETIVGLVGRLEPSKGQDRFLRVIANLRHEGHAVHGLIVGGDAYGLSPQFANSLDGLAQALGIALAVTFTGQVADAAPYFEIMDILVNTSDAEPFGLVLLEAMARGVPVVAFDRAGPAEVVETDQSGLLVPPMDEASMTRAVARLVIETALRERLGRGARQRFNSFFSVARMMGEFEHNFWVCAIKGTDAVRA